MQSSDLQSFAWRAGLLGLAAAALAYASLHSVANKHSEMPTEELGELQHPLPVIKTITSPETYPAVGLHPLFEPSRMPWSPPTAALASPAVPASALVPPRGYVLVGLVMTAHHHAALVRDGGGKTRVLVEGQALDGWSVRGIDAAGAHLQAGEQRFDLAILKYGR